MGKRSLFPVRLDNWDSSFFNTRIARLNIPKKVKYAYFSRGILEFIAQAKREKVRHIVVKLENSALVYGEKLLQLKMRQMGESVDSKFSYTGRNAKKYIPEYGIGMLKKDDIKEIKSIASDSFRRSYLYDCGFAGKDTVDRYHAKWIENISKDNNSRIFVAKENGIVTGFLGLKFDKYKRQGRIVLVAVHKKYRGRGIGSALMSKCIEYGKGKIISIFVKTQRQNHGALRLYKKMGFRTAGRDKIFHKKI